jgi:hypothetical protein
VAENQVDTGEVTGTAAPEANQPSSIENIVDAEISAKETASEDTGKDSRPAEPAPAEQKQEPLIFGKYRTLEDAEKAHKELERQFHESRKPAKADDEQSEGSGPAKDAPLPDLSPEELKQLAEEDPAIYQKYVEAKTQELVQAAIDAKLKPLQETLSPLLAEKQRVEQERFVLEQQKVMDETKKLFGNEYDALTKLQRDPAVVEKVLKDSPVSSQIISLAESGRRAEAHRLLLREIHYSNLLQVGRKRSASVPMDIPSATTVKTGRKPTSIEAAFDQSFEEASAKN